MDRRSRIPQPWPCPRPLIACKDRRTTHTRQESNAPTQESNAPTRQRFDALPQDYPGVLSRPLASAAATTAPRSLHEAHLRAIYDIQVSKQAAKKEREAPKKERQ